MADLIIRRCEWLINEITLRSGKRKYAVTVHMPKSSGLPQLYRRCLTLEEARKVRTEFIAERQEYQDNLKPEKKLEVKPVSETDLCRYAACHRWGL